MIRVGTCSWTEKTLIGSGEFYPKGVSSAEDRLRHYAENFDTVEVDSSYYAIPDRRTTGLWAGRTPEGFVFHVKAYGALTGHGVDPRTLPRDVLGMLLEKDREMPRIYIKELLPTKALFGHFIDALEPLRQAGKLGVVVFQYPHWVHHGKKGFDSILAARELMEGLPIAVEFRHGSWLTQAVRQRVFAFLREHGITYVTADEPQLGDLETVPFVPEVTTETAYFRLHGRNRDNWRRKGIETSLRFDYLYSDDELRRFVPQAMAADRKAKTTYVMFNNCHGGFAVRNSLRVKEMLKAEHGGA